MGIKINRVLPEAFLKALPKEERSKLGKAGWTQEDCERVYKAGQEKELQSQIWNWLNSQGFHVENDRMDKKTSGKKGRADFRACVFGRWLSVEAKVSGETLRPEQVADAASVRRSEGIYVVAYRLRDVMDAVDLIKAKSIGLLK